MARPLAGLTRAERAFLETAIVEALRQGAARDPAALAATVRDRAGDLATRDAIQACLTRLEDRGLA